MYFVKVFAHGAVGRFHNGVITGSPSLVSVAFIRVRMGIFNDSFFGKNT
jgi:hypothetical protein